MNTVKLLSKLLSEKPVSLEAFRRAHFTLQSPPFEIHSPYIHVIIKLIIKKLFISYFIYL